MNRRSVSLLLAAATAVGISWPAFGDQIQLKDGRTIDGVMSRDGDAVVIKAKSGETILTTPDQVTRVTLTSSLTPSQAAAAEWDRTAGLIKSADDLAAIVSLHQKFLDKYPDQDISAGVRASMGEYQKLQRQLAVKFRGRWMPAAQVDTLLRTWQDNARPALELYRAGKLREALDSAKQIVAADDENPVALATAGLAAFRLNDLPASKRYFTKLAAADPSSPLAENNLAVICADQGGYAEGLIHYTKAIQCAPGNRLLLDNIEEAIDTYVTAGGDKTNKAYRDLARQFDQAEGRMETDLAKKDLYRYGSTWVSKAQLTQLTATTESIKAAMTQLDGQYQTARATLGSLNDQIAQAASDYNNALTAVNNLNNVVTGSNNAGLDVSEMVTRRQNLMGEIDRIRTQKSALEAQRDQLALTFTDIYSQADKLKTVFASAAGGQFSGLQRMMELGEDVAPPPPAPVPTPKFVAPPPVAPPAIAPAPVADNQQYQNDVADDYQIISGPLGSPFFPSFPRRPAQGQGRDHGHDHDKPVGTPSGPGLPSGGSTTGTTGAGSGGTATPPAAAPQVPMPVSRPPGSLFGPPSTRPATPPAAPSPSPKPASKGIDSSAKAPADPTKAVPQGGPGSPWSNAP